jgi:hypothetical protein
LTILTFKLPSFLFLCRQQPPVLSSNCSDERSLVGKETHTRDLRRFPWKESVSWIASISLLLDSFIDASRKTWEAQSEKQEFLVKNMVIGERQIKKW